MKLHEGETVVWTVPIGAHRWHASLDGTRYVCGKWAGDRHKGNAQLTSARWPDKPILACVDCCHELAELERAS